MGSLLVVVVFVILVGLGIGALAAALVLVGRVLGLLFALTTFEGARSPPSWRWACSSPSCWGTWAGWGK
jgi:hypothetical protein